MYTARNKRRCPDCGEMVLFGNSRECENCDESLSDAKLRRQYNYLIRMSSCSIVDKEEYGTF